MSHTLAALTESLIKAAKTAGAHAADAIAVDGTSISIDVREGKLEHAERSEGTDIGLRVIIGQKQACVSASDTRPETIQTLAERAVFMARLAPDDPHVGLADESQLATERDTASLDMFDPSQEPNPAELEETARRAEAAALDVNGVTKVQSASAAYGRRNVYIAQTNGFEAGYKRSDRMTSCVAIAGEGAQMERDYCGEGRVYQSDLPSPEEIGALAGARTVARLGARKPKTGAYPVLYDERVSASLIGHLLSAINGTAIARGASWLRDAMGQEVLPSALSLFEEPHRPRVTASRLFDAEGLPTKERAIVENGVLSGWTLDLATARQLGLKSTANAARGLSAPPSPAVSNVRLSAGQHSRDALISDMGTGLLVTSMIGSTINPTTGDYSRGAAGFWIENGEIAYPVNECTIAGNLRDMLLSLVPANDAKPHLSRVVPSLLVEGMTLAGD